MKTSFGLHMIGTVTFFLLCSASAVGAAERSVLQGDRITIAHDRPLLETAEYFQEGFSSMEEELQRLLKMPLGSGVRLVLVQNRQIFEAMSSIPYATAFAVPQDHTIVMYVASPALKPFFLRDTFRHELCHLILHDNIQSIYLPRWLDEGVCQWVSGSLGEFLAGNEPEQAAMLDASRHSAPLAQLDRSFPSDRTALLIAYHQSRKFVEYLSQAYGRQRLVDLLMQLRSRTDIGTAVYRTYGRSLEQLEEDWAEQSHGRSTTLIWLGRNLYEILFAVTLFVAVGACLLRVMRRQKAQRQATE